MRTARRRNLVGSGLVRESSTFLPAEEPLRRKDEALTTHTDAMHRLSGSPQVDGSRTSPLPTRLGRLTALLHTFHREGKPKPNREV